MTTCYFTPDGVADGLARIDLDPDHRLAETLYPDGWVERVTLLHILLTDDNLSWDEIDRTEAEQIAARRGLAPSILDAPRATRSIGPPGSRSVDDPALIDAERQMRENSAAIPSPPGVEGLVVMPDSR